MKKKAISRHELLKLDWKIPMAEIASIFGLSDDGFIKIENETLNLLTKMKGVIGFNMKMIKGNFKIHLKPIDESCIFVNNKAYHKVIKISRNCNFYTLFTLKLLEA